MTVETESPSLLKADDVQMVLDRYRNRVQQHGPTFASLNSGSVEKQLARHRVHAQVLRGRRPCLLDVGCGLAGFYEHLLASGLQCAYTGYDIVPEYVEVCRSKHPGAEFVLRNIFDEGIPEVHDTIVMSQMLNNRYSHSDNVEIMKAAILLAYEHTRVSVSIDMMSSYVDYQSPELFYYSPESIFAFAKTLTRRVALRHDYLPFEFCIQLLHPDAENTRE
jgi:SAM-dependent methyltransferase